MLIRKEKININANFIYENLKSWLNIWDKINKEKDKYSKEYLALKYYEYGKEYLVLRGYWITLILNDDKLFKDVRKLASKNLLFYILLNGWSYDINKTEIGKDPVLPFLPFPSQIPLIDALDGKKHIHVRKSRRQGASAIMAMSMERDLELGNFLNIVTTHKDLASLDAGESDIAKDSLFERVRWLLSNSIFTPRDWKDKTKYWNRKVKNKNNELVKIKKYFTKEKLIVMNGNRLTGSVLGKGTNVGFAGHKIYVDELDVVCDMFPNLAKQIFGGFASSVNQIIIYSTYRSKKYPFYSIYKNREKNKSKWAFIKLHWKQNPTCNEEWYQEECSKVDYDIVLIARELDIDPTKVREGAIFPDLNKFNKIDFNTINFDARYIKVIGADFGGGSSSTVFVFALWDSLTATLYLQDHLKTTMMEGEDIAQYFKDIGYFGIEVQGDLSGTFQTNTPRYSWTNILRANGIYLNPIINTNMFSTHANLRLAFKHNRILINKDKEILIEDLEQATYKNDQVNKDTYSHTVDALSYLWRALTESQRIRQ